MKGFIGFFDILGYQNFLKNNSAEESINKVFDIIHNTAKIGINITKEVASSPDLLEESKEKYERCSKALNYLVFSDTIVFTLEHQENANTGDGFDNVQTLFIACCSAFVAAMHHQGLPVRGVIHEEEFFIREHCLAGKGIIEAYQMCESLNFSGLVCTVDLSEKLLKENNKINNDSLRRFTYQVPTKSGVDLKLVSINWIEGLPDEELAKCRSDIESYVLRSFWTHQKDCPDSVNTKVQNTVKVIRKMIHNIDLDNKEIN